MKEYKVKHAKENSDSITETSHANDSIAFFLRHTIQRVIELIF